VAKPIQGFMIFVREQGVVGLAVGLTMGAAVTALVNSIVNNLVNPIIGVFLPNGQTLSSHYVCLTTTNGVCTNKLSFGAVLSSLVSFITIAGVIYFLVKGLGLDKLDKKKEAK
jgi:large conductance mechanosensitive channel